MELMYNSHMTTIKEQLKVAYDADAKRRSNNEDKRDLWKLNCREYFIHLLNERNLKTILELGAGVGIDSKYFLDKGFDVLATDLSEEMINGCKERGLNARVLDLSELENLGKTFEGIYSMNVLLHTPRNEIKMVLKSISNVLSEDGIFFYGVYGGIDEEKTITDNKKMGLPRYFSFLSDSYLQDVVKEQFNTIKFETIEIGSDKPNFHFQSLYLQKRI
ncbi:MAG: Methylase involved in ubiquinone/menaquinone biosynthesis [candidate division WWE3 bacterium GW2011_GWE1_41_27]|uniref:Methylase involved in ubiquinone/menaquinone biosynthesis n=2 Tax=Katanobacteria TaxID=422282 RepID=A0A0G0W226_UNCKA|nr:MAG: Methylase involved in ubiquinone/menaquinone biosynthesis [candidate division WWE3 bacterium GW2011_GWE1_41_27]